MKNPIQNSLNLSDHLRNVNGTSVINLVNPYENYNQTVLNILAFLLFTTKHAE